MRTIYIEKPGDFDALKIRDVEAPKLKSPSDASTICSRS